eukprot:TCALIF_10437-PA protein Name:"Protein of unknown function" AED:0.22 eAED:0.22 QI:29/0.71/1/1/0.71/0.75/8/55/209
MFWIRKASLTLLFCLWINFEHIECVRLNRSSTATGSQRQKSFGVCCIFALTGCGGVVNRNCTFVRNTGFPGADTNNARTCSVTLNRFVDSFCRVQYSESAIGAPDPFDLDQAQPTASVTDNCMSLNHVTIPSSVLEVLMTGAGNSDTVTIVPSMRCNTIFGSDPGSTVPSTLTSLANVPFVVNLRTLPSDSGRLASRSGFSLDYSQVPC